VFLFISLRFLLGIISNKQIKNFRTRNFGACSERERKRECGIVWNGDGEFGIGFFEFELRFELFGFGCSDEWLAYQIIVNSFEK
jgi:hypothetical protein